MFGKLLKNELKHTFRYVMTVYLCAAAAAAMLGVGMLTKLNGLKLISSIALTLVGSLVIVMTLVSVIKNFYDTLYSRQGYLTFSLPVKSSSILLSKVLVSFFWIIMSGVLTALIACFVVWSLKIRVGEDMNGILDVIRQSGLLDLLPSGSAMFKVVLFIVFTIFTNILVFVSFVYFSVTLANTKALQNHPKLFGFVIFFATYFISNTINTKLNYSFPLAFHVTDDSAFVAFKAMDTVPKAIISYGFGGTVFMVIVSVVLLCLTGWFMENKINVK